MNPIGAATSTFTVNTVNVLPTTSSGVREYIYVGSRLLAVDTISNGQPSAPEPFKATTLSPTSVNLRWGASIPPFGFHISNYEIRRNGSLLAILPGSQRSMVDNAANQNTQYTYSAIARDDETPVPQVSASSVVATVVTTLPMRFRPVGLEDDTQDFEYGVLQPARLCEANWA